MPGLVIFRRRWHIASGSRATLPYYYYYYYSVKPAFVAQRGHHSFTK